MPVSHFCAERAVSEPDKNFTFLSQPFKSTGLFFSCRRSCIEFLMSGLGEFSVRKVIASIDDH